MIVAQLVQRLYGKRHSYKNLRKNVNLDQKECERGYFFIIHMETFLDVAEFKNKNEYVGLSLESNKCLYMVCFSNYERGVK